MDETKIEKLKRLIGDRLATKLMSDCEKAVNDFTDNLADLTEKTLNDRQALCSDELNEPRLSEVKEEAMNLLAGYMIAMLTCKVTILSCLMHSNMGQTMASFIAHAADHFEEESERALSNRAVVLLGKLIKPNPETSEDGIHRAAKSHSSGN